MASQEASQSSQASLETSPPKDQDPEEQNESLTTILSPSQRSDLTLLIASATASMRKTLQDNFSATAALSQDTIVHLSEDDKLMDPNIDPGTADVEKFDRERKLKETLEKEIAAPDTQELKKASMEFFDDWRQGVIQRVGEVVNSKKEASRQLDDPQAAPQKQKSTPQSTDKRIDPHTLTSKSPGGSAVLRALYPPIGTPLASLPREQRILIIHSMLLLLLSLEHYIAPSRVLLLHMTSSLRLPLSVLTSNEEKVAVGLLKAAKELTGHEETQKKAAENQQSRKWKVGIATAAGAAIIGVTGGLAAPLVAAGVGSVMGGLGLGATAAAGYLGSVAGSTVIVGGLFGAYGGRMTGQMMDNYAKEVEDFAFLPVSAPGGAVEEKEKNEGVKEEAEESGKRRLRVAIGISGWLTEEDQVVKPWRVVGKGAEVFALRWELEALMNLGNSIETMVSSAAWGYAQKEIIKRTIFAEMMSAMWPLGLLKVSRVIDNPFSVAKNRAEKAGIVLADALINKAQGERPVTLIGYSLGARVIYSCLRTLAKRRAFGLVESVVMIGAPTPSAASDWRLMRTVVTGRLVNVFSTNDYVLGFMYRTSSIQYGIAGLQRIEGIPSVENVDVSDSVTGHLKYRYLVGSILKKIGFEDIELDEVEKEEAELKAMEEEEEKKTLVQKGMQTLELDKYDLEKFKKGEGAEKEVDNMENQVKEKTQKSLMQMATDQLSWGKKTDGSTVKQAVDGQKSYYQRAVEQLAFSRGKQNAQEGTRAADKKDVNASQEIKTVDQDVQKVQKSYLQMASDTLHLSKQT